jgi:hypothetical protein
MQRVAGQGEAVRLASLVVQRERDDREDVRCCGLEDECLVERSALDRPALGPEPASLGDGGEVERRDGGFDIDSTGSGDLRSPC